MHALVTCAGRQKGAQSRSVFGGILRLLESFCCL
jgi:hypothetical protein